MLAETFVDHAVTYEYPPDGGKIPIVDPYDGCTVGCPYCFQLRDETWNKELQVKTNIPDLLSRELRNWDKKEPVYIGSRCDPYMEIERKYRLTRQCLIELDRLEIPCMVTTKAGTDLIERDLDIIRRMGQRFTLLLGLSNLGQIRRAQDSSEIHNIGLANRLHRAGIRVWVFITPILPGITDVEKMIAALDEEIPVFLDKVRVLPDTRPAETLERFIARRLPHLTAAYNEIIYNDKDVYYERVRAQWKGSQRVRFVFDPN